jgi:ElaB/YqjD/DUF883 family membrane-anchored ribosome-binding protein
MTEQPPNSKAAWEEVGKQFEVLGKSIAGAFGAAWQDPNNRVELEKIKASVKKMADDLETAVGQAASSDKGQQIKADVEKAAQSLAESARETFDEVKPQVTSALKQVGDELTRLVNRFEGKDE